MGLRTRKFAGLLVCFVAAFLLASPTAQAIWVGGNIDVHNGTGLVAHDFHIEGQIKSTTPPTLPIAFGFTGSGVFPNFSYGISPAGGDLWDFKADWSSLDVQPSEVGHFGLFFQATCRNVWVNLDGWWTDRDGNKIQDPNADWPILGFDVPSDPWNPPEEQRFRLQGDSGRVGIPVEMVEMSLMSLPDPGRAGARRIFSMLNVEQMNQLPGDWMQVATVQPGMVLEPDSFFDVFFAIDNVPGFEPPQANELLVARTLVRWPGEPDGRWFFHAHQTHPEPTTMLLLGSGLLGLVLRRRRKK